MELSIYDIIRRTFITPKSVHLYKKFAQYTFEVHEAANKSMIRDAVEKIWSVKVDKIRVATIKGKLKVFNRKPYETTPGKKAIITLKKGYKIEIPGMFESMASEKPATKSEAEGS